MSQIASLHQERTKVTNCKNWGIMGHLLLATRLPHCRSSIWVEILRKDTQLPHRSKPANPMPGPRSFWKAPNLSWCVLYVLWACICLLFFHSHWGMVKVQIGLIIKTIRAWFHVSSPNIRSASFFCKDEKATNTSWSQSFLELSLYMLSQQQYPWNIDFLKFKPEGFQRW